MCMKMWMKQTGITYNTLAVLLGQSKSNIWKKVNGKMAWQQSDLRFFHDIFNLSADFVLGLDDEVVPM